VPTNQQRTEAAPGTGAASVSLHPALPPGLVLLIAVLAMSWAGPLIKFSTAPAQVVSAWRLLFSVAFIALVVLFRRKHMARPQLSARDWALALGFSVAIDLDHLIQIPAYLATHGGMGGLQAATMTHWGHDWQGFMHTQWALALVIPAVIIWRSWIPAAFWTLHMVQDFVVAARYVVFGSPEEFAIMGALAVLVGVLLWVDHRRRGAGATFRTHVKRMFLATTG